MVIWGMEMLREPRGRKSRIVPYEETRNQAENQPRTGMKRKRWIKGVAYRRSERSPTWPMGGFLPSTRPNPASCIRSPTPAQSRRPGTGKRFGSLRRHGQRWVRLCRGQVWPCSPATLPAQSAAPCPIDVVRAGLSPAAGSTSGGTSQAGATPARWLGTRGPAPLTLHPGDVCPLRFSRPVSARPRRPHAASPDGWLLRSGFRKVSRHASEHPGLGCPCRPSATMGSGTKAFTCTGKTSSHIRLWFNTKSDGLRKVSPTGPFTRQTPRTRAIWGTSTLSQLQSIPRDTGDRCAVVTTASMEQQRCSALLQPYSETRHTSYLSPAKGKKDAEFCSAVPGEELAARAGRKHRHPAWPPCHRGGP